MTRIHCQFMVAHSVSRPMNSKPPAPIDTKTSAALRSTPANPSGVTPMTVKPGFRSGCWHCPSLARGESIAPETVANCDRRPASHDVFFGGEEAPMKGLHAEGREIARGSEESPDRADLGAAAHGECAVGVAGGEAGCLVVPGMQSGQAGSVGPLPKRGLVSVMLSRTELAEVDHVCRRTEHHAIDEAHHRGVGADAKGQRDGDGEGEAGLAREQADACRRSWPAPLSRSRMRVRTSRDSSIPMSQARVTARFRSGARLPPAAASVIPAAQKQPWWCRSGNGARRRLPCDVSASSIEPEKPADVSHGRESRVRVSPRGSCRGLQYA